MLPSGYKASAKTNINVKKEKYVKLVNIKEAQEFITTSKAPKQIEVVEDLLKNKISLKSKYQLIQNSISEECDYALKTEFDGKQFHIKILLKQYLWFYIQKTLFMKEKCLG